MFTRKLLLPLLVIALLLVGVSSVFAQDMGMGNMEPCLGLGEEDCALYYEYQHAGLPQSTAFDATIAGNVEAEGDRFEFSVGLSGAYVIDEAAATAAADAFAEVGVLDVSPRDFIELADGTVSAFDAELFIDINGIPGVSDLTGGEPFPTIELWLVDGVAYVDLTPLSSLMGDPTFVGVYGLDVFDIVTTLLEDVTLGDLLPDDMGMGGMDGMGGMGMMGAQEGMMESFNQGFQQGMTNAMMPEEDIMTFATLERLEDEQADGMTLAVFQTNVDIAAAFEVPMIREQVITSIEAQGGDLGDMDVNELIDAIAAATAGSIVTVTERYDTESGYLVSADAEMNFTVDPAPFAELDPDGFTGDEQPLTMNLTVSFARNNINGIDAIELPEGAQIVPPAALFGGMAPQS